MKLFFLFSRCIYLLHKHTHENARASESSIETRGEERIRIPVYSSTFFVMWFYRRSSSSSIFVLVLVLLLVLFY